MSSVVIDVLWSALTKTLPTYFKFCVLAATLAHFHLLG